MHVCIYIYVLAGLVKVHRTIFFNDLIFFLLLVSLYQSPVDKGFVPGSALSW